MSSRTARATIQLPDHSSERRDEHQPGGEYARRRDYRARCYLRPHAIAARSGPFARTTSGSARRRRQAGAGVPARRPRLDPAVARFSGEARARDRLPRAGLRPLRLRAVGRAAPSRRRTVRFMHDEALNALPEMLSKSENREPDPGRPFRRRVDRADPRRRRPRGARRGGDGAACVHRAAVPRVDHKAATTRSRTPTCRRSSAATIATRARRSTAGPTSGSTRSSGAGTSARLPAAASAARCSRSRARTTSTAPWRSSTRSRGG